MLDTNDDSGVVLVYPGELSSSLGCLLSVSHLPVRIIQGEKGKEMQCSKSRLSYITRILKEYIRGGVQVPLLPAATTVATGCNTNMSCDAQSRRGASKLSIKGNEKKQNLR